MRVYFGFMQILLYFGAIYVFMHASSRTTLWRPVLAMCEEYFNPDCLS
jgi:hypothetical protein